MAGDGPGEQAVFFAGAAADIVDQQRALAPRPTIRHNPAMGQLAADNAGDHIAGKIGLRVFRESLLRTAAFEKCPHIRHAAMVDIAIRRSEAPDFGIGGKGLFHIQMDQLLQVQPQTIAIGADDHIGTCAGLVRKIAVRIADAVIGLAVNGGDVDLFSRGFDEAGSAVGALGEKRSGGEESDARCGQDIAPGGLHGRNVAKGT